MVSKKYNPMNNNNLDINPVKTHILPIENNARTQNKGKENGYLGVKWDILESSGEVIIIGGGKSILRGLKLGLKEKLKNKFVITCNYAYKTFPSTFLTFLDRNFYVPLSAKKRPENNPDIYEELKSLPLIVGINNDGIVEFKLDNTILLDKKYKTILTGIFALKLLDLLEFSGNCFLLGFDWSRQPIPKDKNLYNPKSDLQIHFYDNIKHRGVGYTGYFDGHDADKNFTNFKNNKNLKIYNVSLESNITIFPKITYEQFFGLMSKKQYNQENLRQSIKTKLSNIS